MVSISIKNKKNINNVLKVLSFFVFVFFAVYVGSKHEYWADEAQAWLIARDNNFYEILKIIRYEGSPALWHIILRVSMLIGMQYKYLYILPILFTIVGIIFLYKNENIPFLFKILLPFTYFIFFQYTIVARSYCLLFPLLMIIAYIYPERENKLVRYGILLFLLMNVSLHGFFVAGGLWLDYIFEKYVINKKRLINKDIIFCVILAILFLCVIIYVFPAADCTYQVSNRFTFEYVLSSSMFTNSDNSIINIIGTILVLSIISVLTLNRDNIFKVCVLYLPNCIWIGVLGCSGGWHIGILFLIILFISIITDNIKNDKYIFFLVFVAIIIQIYWNIICSINDVKNNFSSGEDVSEYLNEIGYEDKNICGVDFWSVQVNPYFNENIFSNYVSASYSWKKENSKLVSAEAILNSNETYDIYIIPTYYYLIYENHNQYKYILNKALKDESNLIEKIRETGMYNEKYFDANMYYKDRLIENTGLYVFVKK